MKKKRENISVNISLPSIQIAVIKMAEEIISNAPMVDSSQTSEQSEYFQKSRAVAQHFLEIVRGIEKTATELTQLMGIVVEEGKLTPSQKSSQN